MREPGSHHEAMNVQSIEVCNLQLREPGYGIVRDNHLDWIVHLGRHEVHTMKALLPDEPHEAPGSPGRLGHRRFVHV